MPEPKDPILVTLYHSMADMRSRVLQYETLHGRQPDLIVMPHLEAAEYASDLGDPGWNGARGLTFIGIPIVTYKV